MTKTSYSIVVLPGEGIGTEVMDAALEVLGAVEARIGRRFALQSHAAGAQHYADTGVALPEPVLDACRRAAVPTPSCLVLWACPTCATHRAPR
jgi:3-isopropylmalate dehydrogenase